VLFPWFSGRRKAEERGRIGLDRAGLELRGFQNLGVLVEVSGTTAAGVLGFGEAAGDAELLQGGRIPCMADPM
jgi:hypothetical protein